MKEIKDILRACFLATKAGKKTALATVVKVEGSSYRQPGARMLVTEDGELTGAISGGCLEGDALRKALLAINQQQNKLITYDTSNEDDIEFGVQLGCNGIVHILFEYIDATKDNNPIQLLQQLEKERKDAVILTLFSQDRKALQPGTILFGKNDSTITIDGVYAILSNESKKVVENKTSLIKKVEVDGNTYEALIEYIAPPISLVLCGAGNDVKPLVEMASILGWEISVFDGRATHATAKRFPKATIVSIAKPEEVMNSVAVDERTFFVMMTHNYKYDLAMLKLLVDTDCRYIGVLGPKAKLNRMLTDLNEDGIVLTKKQLDRIYGPVGLDIGAETPEEIALSVVAEIKAILSGNQGTSLKYKEDKIHTATLVV
ncbi:XdhC family protein [Flavobacterium piscis]|uniref:Xanthine/CO dehydrogenase XdhC/CoxF family maturation factor n=1 Tax=Flavobacterium piscis TaxID=1114874 RepID=A0ABU1YDM8_9FLAO|nr:XdhC family protein [Flavobacterium piscis]MDR7212347.1 xanthine/CO dehydrogenase XdhC/CoxF family maturation factor [Flavobacterium piscis]